MPTVLSTPTKVSNPAKTVVRKGKETRVYQPMTPTHKKAFEWITDFLRTNHHLILECKARLESGEMDGGAKGSKQDARSRPAFNATYQTFERLPVYFIADYFVTHMGMSKSVIDKIENKKAHQIREMLEFFCGLSESWKWAPVLKIKAVLVTFFDFLLQRLGNRHKGFEEFVDDEGLIDWTAAGPFKFTWSTPDGEPAFIWKVTPPTGPALEMKKARFEFPVSVLMPWSDTRAKFCSDDEYQPTIASFFPKNADFKQLHDKEAVDKKIQQLTHEQKEADKASVIGEAEICTSSKKRKSLEMKARLEARTPPNKCRVPLSAP